jgi:pSer/pThr/pTyr-binding forkhead associated (FHA) protein
MARLILESTENRGHEFKIAGAVVIGRLKTNPIPIDDGKASREHAAVRLVGADYVLADLESRNGTYHNGELVRGQERLRSGDTVTIGATVFRFVEDPEDQARRAELAARAAAPAPVLAQAPPPPSPASPAPPPPPKALTRTDVRVKGPSAAEKFLSFVIHVLVFILSTFVSWWAAGKVIQKIMQ